MLEKILTYIVGILSPPIAYFLYCILISLLAKTLKNSIKIIAQNTIKIIFFNIISLGIVHTTIFFSVDKLKNICNMDTFTMLLVGEFVYLVLFPLFLDIIKINISSISFLSKVKEFTPVGIITALVKSLSKDKNKGKSIFDEDIKTEDLEKLLNSNNSQIVRIKNVILNNADTKKFKVKINNTDEEPTDPSVLPVYANVCDTTTNKNNDNTTTREIKINRNNKHNDV